MIRPVLTELGLFAAPFAAYAIFLLATRAGVLHPDHWRLRTLVWLTACAFVLMIVSFVFIAEFSGFSIDSVYVPAHMENGKFVPGRSQ